MHLGRGLVALLLGVVLALGVLEGLLRLFPRMAASPSLQRELRWRRSPAFAQEPLTKAPYTSDVYSPELGWEPRPNFHGDRLTTNSKGLRGQREYAPQPPPGVRRVLCLGDSFMFGENLTDEESLPAQLEAALNRTGRWEVLNLAVPGYGTDQQWLRLQRVGFEYAADAVVLGFFEEDIVRNIMSFRDYAKPYFELTDGQLVLRNVPVPSPEELLARQPAWPTCRLRLWCTAQWVAESLALDFPGLSLEPTRAGRVTLAILDAMRQAVLNRGMQFVLLTIPRPIRAQPTKTEELLARWAARTGTPMLNAREAYLKLPEQDRTRLYTGHWTAYGAAVTAQLLADQLRGRAARESHGPDRCVRDAPELLAEVYHGVGSVDGRCVSGEKTRRVAA